jgi:hypothetical protein
LQLVEIERAFKELKDDLAIGPIYYQTDECIEAHIFVAFIAYCLQVTLRQRLRALAPGLMPRPVLEKMAAIQMVDVHLPTTDGRMIVLSRYTEFAACVHRAGKTLPQSALGGDLYRVWRDPQSADAEASRDKPARRPRRRSACLAGSPAGG